MTEEQIQPQSAVDSQPKFQKPRKQKVRKDPNAPFIREKLELPEDIISCFSTLAAHLAQVK